MKSYTKESDPNFRPVCKDYFSMYCVEDCNWFGVCWDFQEDVNDFTRIETRNRSDTGDRPTV